MNNYLWIVLLIIISIIIDLYIIWQHTQEGFETATGSRSLYDIMEKEAQISNNEYMKVIRDADVIQSNPWIMIEPVTKNATIHPRDVLDRLTGQQPDSRSWHPRSYYEFSDVLYTGLPL